MDPLSSILRSVRLGSSIISRAQLQAPWGVSSEGASTAIFHAVVAGSCWLKRAGEAPVPLAAGDVVVMARGDAHVLSDDPSTPAVPITSLRPNDGQGIPLLRVTGRGAMSRIICGKFALDHEGARSFMTLLPPILVVRADGSAHAAWVDSTLALVEQELEHSASGCDAMLTRLTDVLFVQLLRRHLASAPDRATGWLAAVSDAQIGRALAMVHEQPAERWNAAALAARVGMSRSSFFERFTALVGEPPASYLARWRISCAADLLRHRSMSTAQLAARVGYASEDAFSRVFRRHTGMSPSEYRRKLRAPARPAAERGARA